MAARMPVADRTIQCHARSGPLIAWDGGRLVPGRDVLAQCFRVPTWRCRPIPVPFALAFPAGVATVASAMSDLGPDRFWLDEDASRSKRAAGVEQSSAMSHQIYAEIFEI